jgi:LmbE family N-acetylglucosaminyl deacetylase
MKLDVLAFAAHRDDLEITCGGTLAKLVEQGHSVGACDLTEGEMGTRGTAAERAAEAEEAARILGLKVRVNAGLPDAGLFNTRERSCASSSFSGATSPRS